MWIRTQRGLINGYIGSRPLGTWILRIWSTRPHLDLKGRWCRPQLLPYLHWGQAICGQIYRSDYSSSVFLVNHETVNRAKLTKTRRVINLDLRNWIQYSIDSAWDLVPWWATFVSLSVKGS